jgi:hypothetical protein
LLNRLLHVPTTIWGPGIDDCATNIVSRIVLPIVGPRTNAASDNYNLGNISNVAGLIVFPGLMRRSRKGQGWHFSSLLSGTFESIAQRFDIVTQSPTEFEAAIVNTVCAYPRKEVSRENADLTRMRRQLG